MFATPAAVLGCWFRGILAIAILAGGAWLVYHWYDSLPVTVILRTPENGSSEPARRLTPWERVRAWSPGLNKETAALACGTLLLLGSFSGRTLNRRLFLKSDPKSVPDSPVGESRLIDRPDGTKLYVETSGTPRGPTVVLTHGWGTDKTEWLWLQREWGTRYRLVAWDLPGLGRSSYPANKDFSLDKMAGDLRAVIEATSTEPVILVGHSIGGMIMLTFCRLYPELLGRAVTRMVIVHSTFTNPLRTMKYAPLMSALQKPLIEPLLYLQIAFSPLVRVMNWLSYWNGSTHNSVARDGFGGTETREQLDFVARYSLQVSPAVLARGSFGMLRYDATQTLRSIPIPVLVVAGDQDPITTAEASQRMSTEIPATRLQTLKPARHYGMIEHHVAFAGSAEAFCSEK
jgi:pimeloyl-ACP methyl ester carboxylesterase